MAEVVNGVGREPPCSLPSRLVDGVLRRPTYVLPPLPSSRSRSSHSPPHPLLYPFSQLPQKHDTSRISTQVVRLVGGQRERQEGVGKGWARTGFGESLAPAASALCPGARWPEKESPPVGAAMTGRSTPLARRDPPSRPCCRKPPSPNFAESASHVPPPGLSLLSGVSGEPSIPQQGNSAEHPPPDGNVGSSPDVHTCDNNNSIYRLSVT